MNTNNRNYPVPYRAPKLPPKSADYSAIEVAIMASLAKETFARAERGRKRAEAEAMFLRFCLNEPEQLQATMRYLAELDQIQRIMGRRGRQAFTLGAVLRVMRNAARASNFVVLRAESFLREHGDAKLIAQLEKRLATIPEDDRREYAAHAHGARGGCAEVMRNYQPPPEPKPTLTGSGRSRIAGIDTSNMMRKIEERRLVHAKRLQPRTAPHQSWAAKKHIYVGKRAKYDAATKKNREEAAVSALVAASKLTSQP